MNKQEIKDYVLDWMDNNSEYYEGELEELVSKALDICIDKCLETIAPRSNSPTASADAEDLISVKEEFQK